MESDVRNEEITRTEIDKQVLWLFTLVSVYPLSI